MEVHAGKDGGKLRARRGKCMVMGEVYEDSEVLYMQQGLKLARSRNLCEITSIWI